jgi:hypothetical protein
MPITININNLSLCHKGSNGLSTATIPDVCNTPSPVGPVPIPYPNIAMSSDLAQGTTTITADGGNMCANYGSEFSKSTGDEPGNLGGVASATFIMEATWITFSFDVKLEGKGACRLTDKMFHNHQNTVNVGGELQPKPPGPDCAGMWRDINKEVWDILTIPDPFERNRQISKAYAEMYQRSPQDQWIGLAAIVSRQAGCAMQQAQAATTSPLPWKSDPARAALDGLENANKTIFQTIYPAMRFAEKYGLDALKQCNMHADGTAIVPPKIMQALDDIAKGTPESLRAAADKIANFEQRDIVQDQVYSDPAVRKAFADNESWANSWWPFGRWLGATTPQLPLSSDCSGTPVPFSGSILNPDDRVAYYQRLMDSFTGKGTAWQAQTMNNIVQQGQ